MIAVRYRLYAAQLALAYTLAGRATDAYFLTGAMEETGRLAQGGLATARDRKMRGRGGTGPVAARRDCQAS